MDRKAVSMWKVTKNLILTDVCVIALFWLIPSVKMPALLLGVLPVEDYQRIAAEFGFIWFWNPGRREQWQYVAEESGETGAALLRIWRGNMVLVIVSLAVMAVLVWMG